jgi:phosphoribosylformylglycinamidine cyclo-ligase
MRKFDSFLLTPTRIYSDMILPNLENIKALSHITGGGIHGNLPRVLPDNITYQLSNNVHSDLRNNNSWWIDLLEMSEMSIFEFENVFNCGWGMIAIIAEEHAECIPHSVILGDLVEITDD